MPNDVTGSFTSIPVRPARAWQSAPRFVPRRDVVIAQTLGVTRWAKPPPGVAWRRALVALLCKLLAMGLIFASIYGAP